MRKTICLLTIALAPLIVACSDSTSPGGSVVGTYTLRTANGKALPTTVYADTSFDGTIFKVEILSGTLTLHSGASFDASTTERMTDGSSTTTSTTKESGTFSYGVTNGTISLTEDGVTVDGTLRGRTITLSGEDGDLVYTR